MPSKREATSRQTCGLVLLATASYVTQAEAAQAATLLVTTKMSQPMLMLFGFTLTAFPVARHLPFSTLMHNGSPQECDEVAEALRRIALQQRGQTGNLDLVDMPDDLIARAFDEPQGLWNWLSPAYDDTALRSQIHPRLLARLEAMTGRPGRHRHGAGLISFHRKATV